MKISFLAAILSIGGLTAAPTATFTFSDAKSIGLEKGVCRRDPSDVIKVGGTCYLWYSRVTQDAPIYPSGYAATVWYATSTDDGRTWTEKGESIPLSKEGFDSHGIFTPNIVVADGKYHLAYTGVAKGFTNTGYADTGRTALGMAVADSPDGPWKKVENNPILETTRDPGKFDSYRIDDACFVIREGKVWLYYKGRSWEGTPRQTRMGVAVAEKPEGPYTRLNDGKFVQDSGHEVMVWPIGDGVSSLVSNTGPNGMTVQHAAKGTDFKIIGTLPKKYPFAPGAYRADLTNPKAPSKNIPWGISMIHGPHPYLVRYEASLPEPEEK